MPRRFMLALAFVSALTGCVAAPPNGPLVEYRSGLTPVTRPVKCEANYALFSSTQPSVPLTEHHITEGERVGFCREPDGSVSAVAPGYRLALPPGEYTWEVIHASVSPWRERFWQQAGKNAGFTLKVTGIAVGVTCLILLALTIILVLVIAKSNTNGFGP
jgi:hypothetical protein